MTLLNFHTNALAGVSVADTLPSGATFHSATTSGGTFTTGGGTVTFDLDSVPAGSNVTMTVAFTVNSVGALTNSATATAAGPSPKNHSASAVTTVQPNPGALVVTTTSDSGPGSLRAAIAAANAAARAGGITFNLSGDGTHVIQPLSPLPVLTVPVTIDGYSQPGAAPNTSAAGDNAVFAIQLDGTNAGPLADGLILAGGHSLVRGLAIYHFTGNGIVLTQGDGDTIAGNDLAASGSLNAASARNGILINNSLNNTIGGASPADRNLISANGDFGIGITGDYTGANSIEGNFIGATPDLAPGPGNALAGVMVSASDDLIGGTNSGDANVITFNGGPGVSVFGSTFYSQYSTEVPEFTDGVGIVGNSIFANRQLGIDMAPAGVTLNGLQSSRTGPDGGAEFPGAGADHAWQHVGARHAGRLRQRRLPDRNFWQRGG